MSGKIDNVCFICPDSLAAGEDRVTTENLDNVNTDINSPVTPIFLLLLDKKKKGLALIIRLLELGIYVIGFFYPVVPKGQARIRVQLSASHTKEHIEKALSAFEKVGKDLGVID